MWNLTKNGVNPKVLYTFLCTTVSLFRLLEPGDNQGYFDIKEKHNNYLLHIIECAYPGVIIPPGLCQNKNV